MDTAWRRLHPLSAVVRLGEALPVVVGIVIWTVSTHHQGSTAFEICFAILGFGLGFGLLSWRMTRWRLEGANVRIDLGILHRQSHRLPFERIQAVDLVQPVLARAMGLAELRLRLAGSASRAGRLAFLKLDEAQALRAHLLSVAPTSSDLAGDAPALGTTLAAVPRGLLYRSLVIDPAMFVLAGWILGVALSADLGSWATVLAVAAAAGGPCFEQLRRLWRRLNAGYDLRVSDTPDGLRTTCGLFVRTTETIPRGRVQGARLVEPRLWRRFGWALVELEVAGGAHEGQAGSSQHQTLKRVLPVGTLAEAEALVLAVFPGAPAPRFPAPPRARWKSPLSYPNLAWGWTDRYIVSRTGWLRPTRIWVPLAKVQGVRVVRGPIHQRLGLATVHLDTAGRAFHGVLRNRDVAEARLLAGYLLAHCRDARLRRDAPRRRLSRQGQLGPGSDLGPGRGSVARPDPRSVPRAAGRDLPTRSDPDPAAGSGPDRRTVTAPRWTPRPRPVDLVP